MFAMLKPFVTKEALSDGSPVQLYPVSDAEIERAEAMMGREFHAQLRQFWREVGYGFIKSGLDGSNRAFGVNLVFHPSTAAKTYLGEGEFSGYRGKGKFIPFFHVDDMIFLALEETNGSTAVVVPGDPDAVPLATSMEEFVKKLLADPEFYDPYIADAASKLFKMSGQANS